MIRNSFNDGWQARPKLNPFAELGGVTVPFQEVTVPHDALIGQERTAPDGDGSGAGAAGAFFPGGVFEYRKVFAVPQEHHDKRIVIEFEGVYRDAVVYSNGDYAGQRPYGKDQQWQASAVVSTGHARLTLRLDDAHWTGIEVLEETLVARSVIRRLDHVLAEMPRPHRGAVTLSIRAVEAPPGAGGPDQIELGYHEDGGFRLLGQVDGRYFSTEVAGGFTGRTVGIEPLADAASMTRFSYRPAPVSAV